jgi:FkbM family methyltransferase
MNFNELKTSYAQGRIAKPQFIESAYLDFHRILFEYASNLPQTDIKEISIDAGGVVFTTRSTGVKVRCQLGDHRSPPFETFNFNDFEPSESHMIHKLFEGCTTFFDIGANIGWHSLNLATKYRAAEFYCFEPIPDTYAELTGNVRLNAFQNIFTYNLGLSDREGQQTFYYYPSCSGNASAVNVSGREDITTFECPLMRLDELCSRDGLPPPDFIKCDVEGAELHVLTGAKATLDRHRPIIMAEILRKWSRKYDYEPNEIFRLLQNLGYLAFTTDGRRLFAFEAMTEETIETNFFFLHPEKHGEQLQRFAGPNQR